METFIIDLDQKKSFISRIHLRQGDGGFQKVLIRIIKNGAEYNASGYSVVFEANLSDGRLVQGNAVARDEIKGLFEYTFRRADAAAVGTMRNAYFKVLDASGNALSTRDVNIIVAKSAVLPTFQHDELLTDVENLVNEVDEKTQELLNSTSSKLSENNQAIANQAEEIAELQEALSDVSLHQAWMTGEDGEGFSNKPIAENLRGGTINSATFTSDKVSGNYITVGGAIKPEFVKKNKYYTISFDVEGTLEKDIKIILQVSYVNENSAAAYYTLSANYPKNKSGITRYTKSSLIENDVTVIANSGALSISSFSGELGSELKITNMKYSVTDVVLDNDVFVPSRANDPINCYPKYVGFGIKNSDNYQDYRWILNPEWAMANAIYGTEITTLKDQLSDIQTWIQAHS